MVGDEKGGKENRKGGLNLEKEVNKGPLIGLPWVNSIKSKTLSKDEFAKKKAQLTFILDQLITAKKHKEKDSHEIAEKAKEMFNKNDKSRRLGGIT